MFVKFKRAGRYARPMPSLPQFEVEVGDVVEVTEDHAKELVKAGAAEITDEPESKSEDPADGDGAGDGAGNDAAERTSNEGSEVKKGEKPRKLPAALRGKK